MKNLTLVMTSIIYLCTFSPAVMEKECHASTAIQTDAFTEALLKAADAGDLAKTKSLVAQGADVNAKNKRGWTALSVAAFNDRMEVIKYLIAQGADIKLVGAYNRTALMNAASNGNVELVKLLLSKGADPKFQSFGLNVLMAAAIAGNAEVVKLLLDKGADVHTKNKEDGNTALFYAANNGSLDIVKLLLEKGADINAINNDKQSVLEYASRGLDKGKKQETLAFIKAKGAKPAPTIKRREMALNKPQMGTTNKFKPQAGDSFTFNFPLEDAVLDRKGTNFVMSFADGTSIELTNFYKVFTKKNVPIFVVDGQAMPADVIFDMLSHALSLDK